ncbi:NUDIX domain-containing protein [Rossellomorea aquimaris]|uniref:NUDIX domain-containing protein n=1 Tax=Rossellomorea aquimaris TaxID=189382 RepID=A0A366ESF5_9BACI|nr:NUDIX domain-containing protein [Rossellomorea aquimaris]RBP04449.1 NUDIX domain-containing protein [Rossellomorea aquimaris]
MLPIKKVYGYVTRVLDEKTQVLVFRHKGIPEAGIQIPKGTVKENEDTYKAVIREIKEETGIQGMEVEKLISEDYWKNDDGAIHNRYFYKIVCNEIADEWEHNPTGGGEEKELTFQFFWVSTDEETELIRGHADYMKFIFN